MTVTQRSEFAQRSNARRASGELVGSHAAREVKNLVRLGDSILLLYEHLAKKE